jgi:uncharacterized membrane protein
MSALLLVTTAGVGLVAGVWFAFSAFVMAGLDRAPAREAVVAMQGINRSAVGAPLMLALFGTALLCVALLVWGATHWSDPGAKWGVAGAATYLVGSVLVTIAGNVPLNDKLEKATPGKAAWSDFYGSWLAFNHVRAVTGLAALVLLLLALNSD